MKLSWESIVLFAIGVADLATTLVWVNIHGASEGNPVFAHYLSMGPVTFAMMKLVMLCAPLFLLEWARTHRPLFTRRAARFAIAAYLALYCVGVVKLNARYFATKTNLPVVAMTGLPMASQAELARR